MPDLPRLRRDVPIAGDSLPTLTFHQWMDLFANRIENNLNDVLVTAIQAAQDAAEESVKETARITSYTNPTVVLSAADVGTDATISISAHTRVYPVNGPYDIPDVDLPAGEITGAVFSTEYYVYYDDEGLTGLSPEYRATTTAANAQVGAVSGRHYIGKITTPANGAAATTGTGASPLGNGVIL